MEDHGDIRFYAFFCTLEGVVSGAGLAAVAPSSSLLVAVGVALAAAVAV
jgi:hypothetical protein